MTRDEQKSVDSLTNLLSEIKKSNSEYRDRIDEKLEKLNKKVEHKHIPVDLNNEILKISQVAIGEAVKTVLTKYDSPLIKLVENVINENNAYLRQIISDSFSEVIRTEDFKNSILQAFAHKVSRSIVSQNDSLFSKVVNDLKQDATFRSKMTLAVSRVVEECISRAKE